MKQSLGINGARRSRVILVATFSFVACLGAFLMGFSTGFATQTTDELNSTNSSASITIGTPESSAFNALFPLGALVGGLFAGWASDTFGRKPAIIIGTVPQLIGWVAITVAHLWPIHKAFVSFIFFGRFFAGLGAGWNSLCIPVYITEISPVDKRGFFGSWNQLFVTIGLLVGYCLGIPQGSFHYYYVSVVAIGITAIFMITMLFIDESPVWLLSHGRSEKGERVLQRLRGSHVDVSKEIDEITGNLIQPEKISLCRSLIQLGRCSVMIPFLLSLGVMFFQQFGGINALTYYASQELQKARVADYRTVSSLSVGGTEVVFTVVGVLLVERLGRKVLLIASSVGMMVSSVMLAVDLYLVRSPDSDTNGDAKRYSALAVTAFVVYNAAFSVGWGPLPWVMMSELVPTSVRGVSTGVATAFNWGSVAVITFAVTYYQQAVMPYGMWFTFGGICFISIFFVAFLIPETKGRSMEEIQQMFETFRYRRYLFPWRRLSEDEPLLV
ncbi:hypothetical protein EMCRGX_G014264 [Ephydatia muelleri]